MNTSEPLILLFDVRINLITPVTMETKCLILQGLCINNKIQES